MPKARLAAGALLFLVSGTRAPEAPVALGQPVTEAEIARADIGIPPDGAGLPVGRGSVARGRVVFEEKCAACHGAAGAAPVGDTPRLTGGIGSLATARPLKTVNSYWPYASTVFDYVRRTMPPTAPQSLSADEVYAVTAYILSVDGIVPGSATLDARTLPRIRMPNRDGFVSAIEPPGRR